MTERYEKWSDGKLRIVQRDSKGHFSGKVAFASPEEVMYWSGRTTKPKEVEPIYRVSWTIKGIPVHSNAKEGRPNYYGFLIQGYHFNPEYLRERMEGLKRILLGWMKVYLMNSNYVDDLKGEIEPEYPIMVASHRSMIGLYKMRVEHNGSIVREENGRLSAL